ncbi:MAG: 2-oxo-hepta-3-ene-1,7-dioic acid hydratase [Planktomarina sp.]|nr:2-oxo-hepta-3-ene-1,7-dioic acid hydratase [Planktomarina sp.]
MTPSEISQAAQDLYQAEKTQKQIGLLTIANPEMHMDNAYAVQKALVALKVADGRRVTGWKIGLTSKAMQAALNIDIPDSGILLDDMHFEDGSTVPKGRFIQPRIEAEIAFVMKVGLDGAATREDVLSATDYVCPSLEILDTRVLRADPKTGQTRKIFDTISDNAANAGVVLGAERHNPNSVDLRWAGAICSRNGEVEETGLGAGVLNDPVMGIVWLSKRLQAYGQVIREGDVVLSGSFIRPIEARPGDRFHADFGLFGNVSIDFA